MTSTEPPRIVEAAFWCWMVAAVLLIAGGFMAVFAGADAMPGNFPGASLSVDQARSLAIVYRVAGVVVVAVGLGIGYLAVPIRTRNSRNLRFAVALSFAILLLEVLLGFLVGIVSPLSLIALLPLIGGCVLATRRTARVWSKRADS